MMHIRTILKNPAVTAPTAFASAMVPVPGLNELMSKVPSFFGGNNIQRVSLLCDTSELHWE